MNRLSVKVSAPRMVWSLTGSVNQPVLNVSVVGTVDRMGVFQQPDACS